MVIDTVHENDHGEYKCVASNAAANIERIIKLNVNIKPKIYDIKNVSVPVNRDIKLDCVARGRPRPTITFRYVYFIFEFCRNSNYWFLSA